MVHMKLYLLFHNIHKNINRCTKSFPDLNKNYIQNVRPIEVNGNCAIIDLFAIHCISPSPSWYILTRLTNIFSKVKMKHIVRHSTGNGHLHVLVLLRLINCDSSANDTNYFNFYYLVNYTEQTWNITLPKPTVTTPTYMYQMNLWKSYS